MRKVIIAFVLLSFFLNGCEQKNQTEEAAAKTEAEVQVKIQKDKEKVQIQEKDLIKTGEFSDGAKIYREKLQKSCSMSGYTLARKRTKEQWEEIAKNGKLSETIKSICPKSEFKNIWTPDIYEYLHKNAMSENS